MTEQLPWNPHASLAWRTEWHQQGWRDVLVRRFYWGELIPDWMVKRCQRALVWSDKEAQAHLWPRRYK